MTDNIIDDISNTPLGIIVGKGDLPLRIAEACKRNGRPVFMLAIKDDTPPENVADFPHEWINLAALGKAFSHLHNAGVKQLVLAGRIERPALTTLRPDAMAAKLLARLGTKMFAGDNKLLSTIVKFLEEEGFEILGAEEVLDGALATEGLIGKTYPDKQSKADIEIGANIAKEIGRLDIGQAVIVQQGHVLGVEAMEGTDQLIERCADLKVGDKGGVLIKVKKPYQEKRVDLPTIGEQTVNMIYKAGFAGIAIEAGGSLIIDRKNVEKLANELGIFVLGFTTNEKL